LNPSVYWSSRRYEPFSEKDIPRSPTNTIVYRYN
jgi:hypothetical protein